MKVVLTKDFGDLKKGDVIECSRDHAWMHINKLKHAKAYTEPKPKKKK